MDTGLYTATGTAGLRRDQAYDELKRGLLVGDFPLHQRLGEERLAALLGVSRTPVREALLRLHAEGLIGPHSEGGYRPIAPDVDQVHDLYEVRMALELQALRRPAALGRTHDLDALQSLHGEWLLLAESPPEPDPGFVTLDEDFHVRLAAASGNPSLADLLRVVNERIRVVRMHDFLTLERVQRTITQHLEIVEAVLAGDLPLALSRFGEHLGESMAVVEARATQALARMATGKGAMQA
ncbi:MAG TPA: GntR family transcriptional regulator [Acidimicrobiales bacterium]|nr:GntR family transcriptional regulator [Acidimicrobiales bacterium]